jgi:hypothetical protein
MSDVKPSPTMAYSVSEKLLHDARVKIKIIGTRQRSAKQKGFLNFILVSFRKGIYIYSIYNIIFKTKCQEKSIKNNSRLKKTGVICY